MKTGQAATRLFGGHGLRNFRPDLLKSTLSIKPFSGFLNLGRTHDHPCEAERTRCCLGTIKHTLRDAQPAVAFIEVHSAKLGVADAAALDTKRTDNLVHVFDNPKGVALCFGKQLEKL